MDSIAKVEFNRRKRAFFALANYIKLKERYSITDEEVDELFYLFLLKYNVGSILELEDKRALSLALFIDFDLLINPKPYIFKNEIYYKVIYDELGEELNNEQNAQ